MAQVNSVRGSQSLWRWFRATRQSELLQITLQNGADVVVAVKVRMREEVSAPALISAINTCERAQFPEVRWLFFEPDVGGLS